MKKLKRQDLITIAEGVGVKPAELRQFLTILYQEGQVENNELIRKTGLAKSILKNVKKETSFLLEKPSQVTALNPYGKKVVRELLLEIPSEIKSISQKFKKLIQCYQKQRPLPKRNFDQFWATQETVVRRVELMVNQGDLEEREILFLGDSDLTSIAAAFTKQAKSIWIVDIDKDVLDFINLISEKEKLGINCRHYDARKVLPSQLKDKFDVVFTDPPYTLAGFKLFLSRSIQALKSKNMSVVYFCYGSSRRSNERELKIQEVLVEMGILIQLKLPSFNHYLGAESIGSVSSIYIGEITPLSKPLIKGKFQGKIYTGKKMWPQREDARFTR